MSAGFGSREFESTEASQTSRSDAVDSILQASLSRTGERVNSSDWKPMRDVAIDCHNRGATLLEFAIDLVRCLINVRMPAGTTAATIAKMSETIGTTLCSDPVSRERLTKLQHELLDES
jgi:hypothetical protein